MEAAQKKGKRFSKHFIKSPPQSNPVAQKQVTPPKP
jgi:hypothetical protein